MAKERFVGAVVLVGLGVVLIPWVLDGRDGNADEPEPGDTIYLPAADDSAPVRTETVELEPRRPPRDAADEPVLARASQADRTDAAPAPEPAAAPDRTEAQAAPAAADGWSVQLGSFSEAANADQLARRVSTYGYSARVSEYLTGGQTLHRVRVGGFASRDQAEVAASSLSAHGFMPRVFPPE